MGTRRKIKNHTSETEASSSPFDDAFVEPSRAMRRKNALVSVGVAMSHTEVRLNQRGLYSFTRTSAPTSRGRSHRFQSSGARRFGYSRGSARMSYPFAKGMRRAKQALFGVGQRFHFVRSWFSGQSELTLWMKLMNSCASQRFRHLLGITQGSCHHRDP